MRVGDELTVGGRYPGDEERRGEIIQVYGSDGAPPYLVRWREGDESVVFVRYGVRSASRDGGSVAKTRH